MASLPNPDQLQKKPLLNRLNKLRNFAESKRKDILADTAQPNKYNTKRNKQKKK